MVGIVQYAGIDGGTTKSITGLDNFLGAPNVVWSVIVFSFFVAWWVGVAAGARYRHGLYIAGIVAASALTAYELIAVITDFAWFAIVLLLAAAANLIFTIVGCRNAVAADFVPQVARSERPWIFGSWLVIAGIGGLLAAYNLCVDKVTVILEPTQSLSCNRSAIVQCGKNLESWQGSLFGFPNPLLGIAGFAVVLLIGIAVLTGVRFPRWWWIAFNVCVIAATAFIVFLIIESVYVIATLCLWCSLVYLMIFPLFWLTTLRNFAEGNFTIGPRGTKFAAAAYTWVPLLSLITYIVVFLLFQTRLDILNGLF